MKKPLRSRYVPAQVRMDVKGTGWGVFMEIVLLYIGLVGYLFCNTTALDMNIYPAIILLIAALTFGIMILLVWYKRVFFSILGGVAVISLLAWKVTFPFFNFLGRSLEVCYNYTIHLLAIQPNYSDYQDYMTMDIGDILKTPVALNRYFYAALILLSLIGAIFFALALFRRIPPIVSFLVCGLFLIPLFFYGIVPHYVAFSIFLSALIGCYGQSLIRYILREKKPKEKGKKKKKMTSAERLAFASRNGSFGVVITAIMLLITIVTASVIYTRPIVEIEQVREAIDMTAEDAMNLVFAETYEKNLNVAGYLEEDEPLTLDVPRWRRLKVAKVESTIDQPVYLRFRTTMTFTEEGWLAPDQSYNEMLSSRVDKEFYEYTQFYEYLKLTAPSGDPAKAELDLFDSEVEGYVNDVIHVTPQYRASKILGLPAGIADASPVSKYKDLERISDTMLTHTKTPLDRNYSFKVTSPVFTSDEFLGKFQTTQEAYLKLRAKNSDRDFYLNNEQAYSGLVKNYYSTLPAKVRKLVSAQAKELTQKYDEKLEKVQAIERYFRENYAYSTQRRNLSYEDGTPADAFDQIRYFLYENEDKDGFCTLFATSMTAMLRSIGIPARVVTGYYTEPVIDDTDKYTALLTDKDYHAWVEVYFDGLGWLSFEPTPGFGVIRNYNLLKLAEDEEESEFADETPTIHEEQIEGEVEKSDLLPEPEPPKKKPPQYKPQTPEEKKTVWISVAIYFGLFLLFLASLAVLALLLHRRHMTKLRKLPPNEAVKAGYYITLRLMQMRGFKFFEGELLESFARRVDNLNLAPIPMQTVVAIMQKALYGTESIREEEREKIIEFTEALDQNLFKKIDPFRAFWFSLILSKKPYHKSMIWKF